MVARLPDAAIYRRIAAELRARIADGRLQPGQRLGSMADLGYEFEVGLGTIARVTAVLRSEGLIVGAPGEVPRVADKPRPQLVTVPYGAEVSFRPATTEEAAEQGLPVGAWMAVVVYRGRTDVYPVDRTIMRIR
jgi:DNA-binding transcriptional MocR family regulator